MHSKGFLAKTKSSKTNREANNYTECEVNMHEPMPLESSKASNDVVVVDPHDVEQDIQDMLNEMDEALNEGSYVPFSQGPCLLDELHEMNAGSTDDSLSDTAYHQPEKPVVRIHHRPHRLH